MEGVEFTTVIVAVALIISPCLITISVVPASLAVTFNSLDVPSLATVATTGFDDQYFGISI